MSSPRSRLAPSASARLPLHVANGESTAITLRDTGLKGEVYSWFDFLMEGPLDSPSVRAAYLEREFGVPAAEHLAARAAAEAWLASCAGRPEVVLWFEGDLSFDDGRFELLLPPGDYLLRALSPAGTIAEQSISVDHADQTVELAGPRIYSASGELVPRS